MKNRILIIIIVFLTILSICLLGGIISIKQHLKEFNQQIEISYKDAIFENTLLANPGFKIDSSIVPLIFKESTFAYSIIYRYDTYMCTDCIFKELELLKRLSKTIGDKSIFILPSTYDNSRESLIGLKSDLKRFNYVTIPIDKMQMPKFQNENRRYFAVVDKSGKIISLFIPISNLPSLTMDYLNSFCMKWFR